MKTLLGGFLSLAMVLLAAMPAKAADPAVTVRSTAGFEGMAKSGKWVPVEVTIENAGAEFEGVIRFAVDALNGGPGSHRGTYETAVAVPAGATKRVQIAVPSDVGGTVMPRLEVGDQAIADIPYQVEMTSDLLVGLLGVEPAELPGLAGKTVGGRRIHLVGLNAERLPSEPLFLENLDAILLDRFAYAELALEKQQALQRWVEQGGVLIAAAGPEAKRLEGLSPWISLPVTGLQTVKVDGVGTAPIAQVRATGGWAVEQRTGALPLALRLAKGQGSVHLLTFDPALEPFASWQGLVGLVAPLLPEPDLSGIPGQMPGFKSNMALADNLNQFPMREIPSAKALLILLGVYALLIGPVHFLLLRGFRRLGWAVLTLPVLVAAGGGGAWAYTKKAHASDVLSSVVAVMEGHPGSGSMRVSMMAGFFLPPGSTHRVTVGNALLSPVAPTYAFRPDGDGRWLGLKSTYDQGRAAVLEPKDQWGMQAVSAETIVDSTGTVSGELVLGPQRMTGRITSHLPFDLKGVLIASGTSFVNIGDLKAGQTADVELMAPAFAQQFGGDNPLAEVMGRAYQWNGGPNPTAEELQLMRRQQMGWAATGVLSWIKSGQKEPGAVLLGWTDEAPLPVKLDGRSVAASSMTLYVQPLPVGVSTSDFTLPSSMVQGRMVDSSSQGQAGVFRPGWNMAQGDWVVIDFDVPLDLVSRVTELEVRVPSLGGLPNGKEPLTLSLFRWTDASWHEVPAGRVMTDPAFVGPGGKVRAKAVQDFVERIPLGKPGLTVRGRGVKP